MSRRRSVQKRTIIPDAKYHDNVLAKFMNCLMIDGKKSLSENIVYGALNQIQDKVGTDPVEVFKEALNNVKPSIEVKSRRVGGATYQVPVEVRPERAQALAIRWLIAFSRKRSEKTMKERLFHELVDAYNQRGASIKKKEDTHKMAEANKANAHYRW